MVLYTNGRLVALPAKYKTWVEGNGNEKHSTLLHWPCYCNQLPLAVVVAKLKHAPLSSPLPIIIPRPRVQIAHLGLVMKLAINAKSYLSIIHINKGTGWVSSRHCH
jgi:hypothetical protein